MKSASNQNSSKKLMKVSVAMNVILGILLLLTLFFPASLLPDDEIDIAHLNYLQEKLCVEDYDERLAQYETDEQKNIYAMTVCLKNYKTGEDLDLQPLINQVDETAR